MNDINRSRLTLSLQVGQQTQELVRLVGLSTTLPNFWDVANLGRQSTK